MSVKRSSVRRRRSRARRAHSNSSYLTLHQKKRKNTGRVIFWCASVVTIAAIALVGVFIWKKYLKDSIIKKTDTGDVAEQVTETAETETETEVETTAYAEIVDPYEEKMKAQAELEAYVHEVDPNIEMAHFKGESTLKPTGDEILDRANLLAEGYDYDTAIELIKGITGYGNEEKYTDAIARYTAEKNAVAPWVINNNITHIFFHSLIVDPSRAFGEAIAGSKVNDYNEAMTTVNEFVATMESMYEKGFVLVDIYDVAKMETQPDGTSVMTYQQILLPPGKKPFILSIDDTNYYEYMTGHGFSTKLVVDENGKVQNEYVLSNGEAVYGSFDVITILEDFIEMHPDFSYRGGRGMAGITGYNGVLGYRTCDFWYNLSCEYYESTPENDKYRAQEVTCPNPNIEEDKVTAKKVADAIKAMGWRFASHSWGHKWLGHCAMTTFIWDADMWDREVRPILGDTDLLILPYGDDFGPPDIPWQTYTYNGYVNERYDTVKAHGFNYIFNVDSSEFFMQRTNDYFRQGRRNLDGDRFWEAVNADDGYEGWKNRVSDLYDNIDEVIDPLRPRLKDDSTQQ